MKNPFFCSLTGYSIRYILILFLTFCYLYFNGCNEAVNITGTFLNKVNINNNFLTTIIVVIKNHEGHITPNYQVNIKNKDSIDIVIPKFSGLNPVEFDLQCELLYDINYNEELNIIINYPAHNILYKRISMTELHNKAHYVIEFNIGIVPDSIKRAPLHDYIKFKPY